MIIAGLVVLAVAASLFMIFSESVQLLRVGLVIALWAATLGAIAMTKYRRESALDKAKVRDLQKVYELQLEREIGARREYELGVEARVRGELGAEAENIAALREELAALRKNLEVLFEGRLPEERTALRAESTRVQELAGGRRPAAPGPFRPATPPPVRNTAPRPVQAQSGPSFASPYDDPVTAETSVVPEPIDVEVDVVAEPQAAPVSRVEPVADPAAEPAEAAEAAEAVEAGTETVEEAEASESPAPSRRSRRRAEDATDVGGAHSNGLSVAEIMANMKSADSGGAEPRRRRRAE
ncbi:DUF6779 domain-containing protein [Prescottella defluvii]